jgi:hypothetical protein
MAMSLAASGNAVCAGFPGGIVFRTTDFGISWASVEAGLPPNDYISAFTVRGGDLFAGTSSGGFFHSTDKGAHWSAVDSCIANSSILSLVANGGDIFAGTYHGIFLSTNDGRSWAAVDSGPPNNYITSFAIHDGIFAAIQLSGVFLSTNNGQQWSAADSGLRGASVRSLEIAGTSIFAATLTGGVWHRPLSEIIGGTREKSRERISQQAIFKIHVPRRDNRLLSIEFSLPHADRVSVTIFDLSGHIIVPLVNGNRESGTHCITWDTRNVVHGCYMVRMNAGAQSFTECIPVFR